MHTSVRCGHIAEAIGLLLYRPTHTFMFNIFNTYDLIKAEK